LRLAITAANPAKNPRMEKRKIKNILFA
jgi:hypothetical protein